MRETITIPDLPGYISIKQTAKMLGISDKRVYQYIGEGRLPAVRAGHNIMLSLKAVEGFKPNLTGRPRKGPTPWHTLRSGGPLVTIQIRVQIIAGQQEQLAEKLHRIEEDDAFTFVGTVARYVIKEETNPAFVSILLIGKKKDLPDRKVQEEALVAFKAVLADVVDWNTAQFIEGTTIIHT